VQLQKISILPPKKGLEFPMGWGFLLKNYRNRVGGGVLEKCGRGMEWMFSGTTQSHIISIPEKLIYL